MIDVMEGGGTTSPLLGTKNGGIGNMGFDNGGGVSQRTDQERSSSATFNVAFSSLVAVCGSYIYGNSVGYSSPAESGIVDDLGLSLAEYSLFGSLLAIGAMLGAVFSGRIAEFMGRRWAMGISEIFCIIGWLAILSAKGAWWLDIGRFLLGCGVGILSYAVPVYITEITPKDVRGGFTSLNQLLIGCGQALTFLIGSFVSWRTLALNRNRSMYSTVARPFFNPGVSKAKIGRLKEFEATLKHLRGKQADISQEAADIIAYTDYIESISEKGILNLFQRQYAHLLIVGVGLMAFKEFGGLSGFASYTSTIFESAGFSGKIGIVAAAVIQIVMTAFGVLLIDKSGRRPILLISATGTFLGCVITGLAFLFQDLHSGTGLSPILVLIGVLVFLGSFQFGMGGIPWIIMSEIFPITIKGSAGSLVNLVSWLGSWFTAYTFNFSFEWSSAGTFFIYAGICAVGILFVAWLVPETKGRTLEEIQASMTRRLQ